VRIRIVEKLVDFLEYIFHVRLAVYLLWNLKKPQKDDFIFDIGANKGTISKLYSKIYQGPKIIAIEPLPIFELKSDQIEWMQVAVAEREGSGDFYVSRHTPSSSLILPNPDSKWLKSKAKILGVNSSNLYEKIQVEVTTLDRVIKDRAISRVFLLKIDTEGAELIVLKGALESLRMGKIQNIQLESQSDEFRKSNRDEIFALLSSFNYVHVKSLRHLFGSFREEFFVYEKSNIVTTPQIGK
jgi:FkbM family methyltransferase